VGVTATGCDEALLTGALDADVGAVAVVAGVLATAVGAGAGLGFAL
jgi:hypothetical protein